MIFVDDEIGSGATFRACMDLLFAMDAELRLPLCVFVVAEDLWFQPPSLTDIEIRFRPFGRREEGLSMTSRLIPPDFEREVRRILAPQEARSLLWKRATNILMDLPVKELTETGPRWTYKYRDEVAARLPELSDRQADFGSYLDDLIRRALDEVG